MTSSQQTDRIADLLYKSGIISQDQLANAMATSIRTTQPIGVVLVESKIVPMETIRTAGIAHSLLDENLISLEQATSVLHKSITERISLEEAFEQLGLKTDFHFVTARLRQILTEAEIVSEEDINNAIEASYTSGLPLGRVLVVRNVVPEAIVYAALTAQVLIKEGKITAENAIRALHMSFTQHKTVEDSLGEIGAMPTTRREPIRLGELLIAAGLVSEIDLLSAVEKGMSVQQPIGQVLLHHKLISDTVLKRALAIQYMVNNENMNPMEAVSIIRTPPNPESELLMDEKAEMSALERQRAALSSDYSDLEETTRMFGLYKKEDWMRTIQELTLEKENLAFKVVSQQEEMKYRLARELHDTIIADLMMLKRYLGGDKKLSNEETIEIVDHIIRQLRDICSDFAPRNFKEWGLKMCLQDMLERLSQRTGIQSSFHCDFELPELPDPVGLHIFRIIQEGLNNIEKYAGASEVSLEILNPQEKQIKFVLRDNGKGFDPETGKSSSEAGGMGMGGMKERADLIRCFYSTSLSVDSQPGQGSIVTLEIEII